MPEAPESRAVLPHRDGWTQLVFTAGHSHTCLELTASAYRMESGDGTSAVGHDVQLSACLSSTACPATDCGDAATTLVIDAASGTASLRLESFNGATSSGSDAILGLELHIPNDYGVSVSLAQFNCDRPPRHFGPGAIVIAFVGGVALAAFVVAVYTVCRRRGGSERTDTVEIGGGGERARPLLA
jgi:hypothetical protein